MHRPSLSFVALVLGAACSKPAQQQQATAAPAVQWAVIVLYNQPKDTAAFERYYAETHVPLFAVRFESRAALDRGVATAGFKAVAADLANFATGGVTVLIGEKTN